MAKPLSTITKLQKYIQEQAPDSGKNAGPFKFSDKTSRFEIALEVDDFDRFTFLFRQVKITAHATERDLAQVRERVEAFTASVTYLRDELKIVEVDELSEQINVRSAVPHPEPGQISYFNLLVSRKGELTFERRLNNRHTRDTSTTSFSLSNEIADRLIRDLLDIFRK